MSGGVFSVQTLEYLCLSVQEFPHLDAPSKRKSQIEPVAAAARRSILPNFLIGKPVADKLYLSDRVPGKTLVSSKKGITGGRNIFPINRPENSPENVL